LDRLPKLLIAAVVAVSAPLPAAAQGWPATVVAGAPQMAAQKRLPMTLGRETSAHRTWSALQTPSSPSAGPVLKLSARHELGEVPDVDVPAKDEWTADEGFRVGPTKLAFKRRF